MTATSPRYQTDLDEIREALIDRTAELAHELLGEPNTKASTRRDELRYGTRGSLSIDLATGRFFDHEVEKGGDLFELIMRERGGGFAEAVAFARSFVGKPARSNGAAPTGNSASLGLITASYDYTDENGALLFQVCRFEPKDFRQRRRPRADDPPGQIKHGWVWSVKGVRPVPYRLPDLLEQLAHDRTVVIVEGEKDADALWAIGVPATCNAGGAGKWRKELTGFFRGADVVIIPDNDPQTKHPKTGDPVFHPNGAPVLPGRDHAQAVAKALLNVAARVRLLDLSQHWPQMPPKGDVSDWLGSGHTRDELDVLIGQAVDYRAAPAHLDDGPLPDDAGGGVTIDDFYAFMPNHSFIFVPTREMWPADSVNARVPPVAVLKKDGTPVLNEKGNPKYATPQRLARQPPAGRANDLGAG